MGADESGSACLGGGRRAAGKRERRLRPWRGPMASASIDIEDATQHLRDILKLDRPGGERDAARVSGGGPGGASGGVWCWAETLRFGAGGGSASARADALAPSGKKERREAASPPIRRPAGKPAALPSSPLPRLKGPGCRAGGGKDLPSWGGGVISPALAWEQIRWDSALPEWVG